MVSVPFTELSMTSNTMLPPMEKGRKRQLQPMLLGCFEGELEVDGDLRV